VKKYQFTVVASGLNPEATDFEDRFFEAGCDDATISIQKGAIVLEFSRAARSLGHALRSAIADVQGAGAKVLHVEPDHWVSLSDLAARSGLTRAAASLYAKGLRGDGFPAPAIRVTTENPLWDWVDVARWLHRQGRLDRRDVVYARIVRSANIAILAAADDRFAAFAPSAASKRPGE